MSRLDTIPACDGQRDRQTDVQPIAKTCFRGRSYLRGRSYAVVAGGTTSETVDLDCGIPQGSSLGPLKFVVYAADLHNLTSRHHVMSHSFADDTQLYRHTKVRDVQLAKKDMLATIVDINWSQSRGLKLNAEKSEIIWLGTRQQLTKLSQATTRCSYLQMAR